MGDWLEWFTTPLMTSDTEGGNTDEEPAASISAPRRIIRLDSSQNLDDETSAATPTKKLKFDE